jgi:hypothetical protein
MHVDSDVHRSDIATHSLLGGQHGEESEEGKEGKEGQEEEEDEVTFLSERRIRQSLSKAASQRPARPKDHRNAVPSGHAGPGRRRRASAKPRSSSHGTDDRFARKVGQQSWLMSAPHDARAIPGTVGQTISVFRRRPRSCEVSLDPECKAPAHRAGACSYCACGRCFSP